MFLLNSEWTYIVCGTTAHVMCGRFEIFESARHFRIEFESDEKPYIRLKTIVVKTEKLNYRDQICVIWRILTDMFNSGVL